MIFCSCKINEIVNKVLLEWNRFIAETHLRQLGFIYRACVPLYKHKEKLQKFEETGNSRYIYQNKLDIACFHHDMAHGSFKDLSGRTTILDKL